MFDVNVVVLVVVLVVSCCCPGNRVSCLNTKRSCCLTIRRAPLAPAMLTCTTCAGGADGADGCGACADAAYAAAAAAAAAAAFCPLVYRSSFATTTHLPAFCPRGNGRTHQRQDRPGRQQVAQGRMPSNECDENHAMKRQQKSTRQQKERARSRLPHREVADGFLRPTPPVSSSRFSFRADFELISNWP